MPVDSLISRAQVWWLQRLRRAFAQSSCTLPLLPDLAPNSEGQELGAYIDALDQYLLTRAERIREIAITGPYAAGKSSFLHTYRRQRESVLCFITVSLATYLEGGAWSGGHDHTQLAPRKRNEESNRGAESTVSHSHQDLHCVEHSILKQLLYLKPTGCRACAKSRFRDICSYLGPLGRAFVLLWVVITADAQTLDHLALKDILTALHMLPASTNLGYIFFILAPTAALVLLLVRDALVWLKNHRLSRINLVKGELEITPNETPTQSVFIKHLDSICAILEKHKVDVVIFEDLDRFDTPDIFSSLKELNTLINGRRSGKVVRFVYAIRDDVFDRHYRTKSFDAIIPILPFTNEHRSYAQFRKILDNTLGAEFVSNSIDDELLRKIARYINDMRLLKSIVVEFCVYREALSGAHRRIQNNQLLAYIVYKNYYPKDFNNLHNYSGLFYSLLESKESVRQSQAEAIREGLDHVRDELAKHRKYVNESQCELDLLYFMKVVCQHNFLAFNSVHYDGTSFWSEYMFCDDYFWKAYEQKAQVKIYGLNQSRQDINKTISLYKSISEWYPHYPSLRESIGNNSNLAELTRRLRQYQARLTDVDNLALKDLLLLKPAGNEHWEQIRQPEWGLLCFLLVEGYLDEKYRLYSSPFAENDDVSPNDVIFIDHVMHADTLPIDFALDSPVAIIRYLHIEEFVRPACANVKLVAHLLMDLDNHGRKLEKILMGLQLRSSGLATAYQLFVGCNHNGELLIRLNKHWPQLFTSIAETSDLTELEKNTFLVYLMLNIPREDIVATQSQESISVHHYLEAQGYVTREIRLEVDELEQLFDALGWWKIQFVDLSLAFEDHVYLDWCLKCDAYALTLANLKVLGVYLGIKDALLPDYSQFKLSSSLEFNERIERELLRVARLAADGQIRISAEDDVLALLSHGEIDDRCKVRLLGATDVKLSKLPLMAEGDPLALALVQQQRLEVSWNIAWVLLNVDTDVFREFLEQNYPELAQLTADWNDSERVEAGQLIPYHSLSLSACDAIVNGLRVPVSINEDFDLERVKHLLDIRALKVDEAAIALIGKQFDTLWIALLEAYAEVILQEEGLYGQLLQRTMPIMGLLDCQLSDEHKQALLDLGVTMADIDLCDAQQFDRFIDKLGQLRIPKNFLEDLLVGLPDTTRRLQALRREWPILDNKQRGELLPLLWPEVDEWDAATLGAVAAMDTLIADTADEIRKVARKQAGIIDDDSPDA